MHRGTSAKDLAQQRLGPQPVPLAPGLAATCPLMVTIHANGDISALPITRLEVNVQCHASVALVRVQLEAGLPAGWREGSPLYFLLPRDQLATVTSVTVDNRSRDEVRARLPGAGAGA